MSSISLIDSNRKVCARYDGQNRRFRSFTTIDPTTRKACKSMYVCMVHHTVKCTHDMMYKCKNVHMNKYLFFLLRRVHVPLAPHIQYHVVIHIQYHVVILQPVVHDIQQLW